MEIATGNPNATRAEACDGAEASLPCGLYCLSSYAPAKGISPACVLEPFGRDRDRIITSPGRPVLQPRRRVSPRNSLPIIHPLGIVRRVANG